MNRKLQRREGKGTIELIEEAVQSLRLAPVSAWAAYYVGSMPFVLGLLYFWAEMSGGAYADRHCAEAALVVSLLYLWMKSWQTVFAQIVLAQVRGGHLTRWDWRRVGRMVATQATLQPTGLFALPVALLIALPFGWVYAFYHNVTIFGDGSTGDLREVTRKSRQQSNVWLGQNHLLISLLFLFGVIVFLNVFSGVFLIPILAKMLLGIESIFTRSPLAFLNSTLFAALLGITYLCVNPLVKMLYVLRCFYGESLHTGADLKAELKSLRPVTALVASLVLFLATATMAAPAVNTVPKPTNPELPAQLDHSIDDVLSKPEYTWRMPREAVPTEEKGMLGRFVESIIKLLSRMWRVVVRLWDAFMEWLNIRNFKPFNFDSGDGGTWAGGLHALVFILIVIATVTLALLLIRIWRQRRRQQNEIVSEPLAPVPDLNDENVLADQLPADGWLAQARELIATGELRLALRALFLASLAHLAQRDLIAIAKFKSNRDYERELHRRAHTKPVLLEAFDENRQAFESAWYGMHEVTPDALELFTAKVNQIREVS